MVRDTMPFITSRAVIALLVARKLVRAQRFRRVSPDSWGRSTAARAHAIQSARGGGGRVNVLLKRWRHRRACRHRAARDVTVDLLPLYHYRPDRRTVLGTCGGRRLQQTKKEGYRRRRRVAPHLPRQHSLSAYVTGRPLSLFHSVHWNTALRSSLMWRVSVACWTIECDQFQRGVTRKHGVSRIVMPYLTYQRRGKGTCAPDANVNGAPKRSLEWFNNILYEMFKNINKMIATKLLNTKLMRSNIFNLVLGAKS